MTSGERDVMILQRKLLLDNLSTIYPAPMAGDKLFSTTLFVFPDYTRHRCMRDLIYLAEKGYIARRQAGRRDNPAEGEWRSVLWAATAAGMDVAQKLREDSTLEV